jgi:serine/threonine protein kinase
VFEHIREQMAKKVKQEDIFRDIALQMFDGILKIHSVERVHRDIKLDNIRVHEEKVYITDFGCIYKVYNDKG